MFLPLCGTLCTSWDRTSGRLSFFLYGIWCTTCSLHISFLAYPRPSALRCFLIFAEIRNGIFCSHRVDPGVGDGEMEPYLFCRRLFQCWRRPYSDQPLLKRLRNRRSGLQPAKTLREVLFSKCTQFSWIASNPHRFEWASESQPPQLSQTQLR